MNISLLPSDLPPIDQRILDLIGLLLERVEKAETRLNALESSPASSKRRSALNLDPDPEFTR